jgi:hypothetical protein
LYASVNIDSQSSRSLPGNPVVVQVYDDRVGAGRDYGVGVDLCPPGHSWRKGAVEKAIHVITQRCGAPLDDDATLAAAGATLDATCIGLDRRCRRSDGQPTTVEALAEAEPLRPVPGPFAATVDVPWRVSTQALVALRRPEFPYADHLARPVPAWSRLSAEVRFVEWAAGLGVPGFPVARACPDRDATDGPGGAPCRTYDLDPVGAVWWSLVRHRHRRPGFPGRRGPGRVAWPPEAGSGSCG